jgi:hypothetical protein
LNNVRHEDEQSERLVRRGRKEGKEGRRGKTMRKGTSPLITTTNITSSDDFCHFAKQSRLPIGFDMPRMTLDSMSQEANNR